MNFNKVEGPFFDVTFLTFIYATARASFLGNKLHVKQLMLEGTWA